MATKRNYPPIICNRCNESRSTLTKCERAGCDFEIYRDAIWDRFKSGPPPKVYCTLTGGVNAGKTFYLLSLVDALTKDASTKSEILRYGIKDVVMIDPISRRYYKEFLNECKNGRLSITLPTEPLSFFSLFITTSLGNTFEVVVFNTSGEKIEDAFQDEEYRTEAHELKGASTIHFVDPFEDTKLNALLRAQRDMSFGPCKDYNIVEYVLMIMKYMSNGTTIVGHPTAICISKFDLLLHHIPFEVSEYPYVYISSDKFFHDINTISMMLARFLEKNSTTINPKDLQKSYENLNYFAVAPFGNNSVPAFWHNKDSKGILPPFLWILKELKILPEQ